MYTAKVKLLLRFVKLIFTSVKLNFDIFSKCTGYLICYQILDKKQLQEEVFILCCLRGCKRLNPFLL